MNLSNDDLQSFATAVLDTYKLESLRVNESNALKEIAEELSFDFKDLNSLETKKVRCNRFQVGEPDDYSETLIEFEDEKKLICGIRHQGCNPDMPFINCIPNFAVRSKSEAISIAKTIFPNFLVFKPKYICFWAPREIGADFVGSIYLVADLQEVKDKKSVEATIELESITDESYYEWYEKGYAEFHRDNPDLKWKVTVNSKETMNESLEHGLLSYAKINGEKIGLIAAIRSDFLGLPGIYFNEIFISREWKGKGMAREIQKTFVLENCKDNETIWGTIDADNLPSLKTALSNGRKPIRYESFFDVGDVQ